MATTPKDEGATSEAEASAPLPELRPWLEMGWIFRDGEAVVVERQGVEVRTRQVAH
jgi:hypothetical protein